MECSWAEEESNSAGWAAQTANEAGWANTGSWDSVTTDNNNNNEYETADYSNARPPWRARGGSNRGSWGGGDRGGHFHRGGGEYRGRGRGQFKDNWDNNRNRRDGGYNNQSPWGGQTSDWSQQQGGISPTVTFSDSGTHPSPTLKPSVVPKEDPYDFIVRTVPRELVMAKFVELINRVDVSQENVNGVGKCLLAWAGKDWTEPLIKILAKTYCSKHTPDNRRLAIFYVFNDVVQKDLVTFQGPGYHHFLLVIAPLVALLPENVVNSHCRTLDVLRERRIYSRDCCASLKKIMQTKRHEATLSFNNNSTSLSAAQTESQLQSESAIAAVRSRVVAIIRATKIVSVHPPLSDIYISTAKRLLAASGRTFHSPDSELRALSESGDALEPLTDCLTTAIEFSKFEVEALGYLLLDWAFLIEENNTSLKSLVPLLDTSAWTSPSANALVSSLSSSGGRDLSSRGGLVRGDGRHQSQVRSETDLGQSQHDRFMLPDSSSSRGTFGHVGGPDPLGVNSTFEPLGVTSDSGLSFTGESFGPNW